MTSISVKLEPVGTTFYFSEKSYRFFKIGYIGSITLCTLAIAAITLENNALLSNPNISNLLLPLPFIFFTPTLFLLKHSTEAKPDSTVKVSYLPAINLGLMFTLMLLWFYTGYLRYGGA
jgi:hypothetical protein